MENGIPDNDLVSPISSSKLLKRMLKLSHRMQKRALPLIAGMDKDTYRLCAILHRAEEDRYEVKARIAHVQATRHAAIANWYESHARRVTGEEHKETISGEVAAHIQDHLGSLADHIG
jgi:hypothetical protein